MRTLIFILFLCISRLGLSQNKLEMVPNGDFSKYTDYTIPAKQWKDYFGDKIVPVKDFGLFKPPKGYEFWLRDLYDFSYFKLATPFRFIDTYLKGENSYLLLNSWYPYADSSNQKINFDSLVYQDTFNFRHRGQYVNNLYYFHSRQPFNKDNGPKVSKLRVCGKNLYNLTSPLSAKTRTRAYYNLNLNLMYDWPTYIYTMIYRGYISGGVDYADPNSIQYKYPELEYAATVQTLRQPHLQHQIHLVYGMITLDSHYFARNNNFKITLLNTFFKDSCAMNFSRMEQDIWQMPLFPDIYDEKHFTHRFKSNGAFSFLQLRQKHADSVQYYANDTVPFPQNEDSLLYLITDGGKFSTNRNLGIHDTYMESFHPLLCFYPQIKQWQYPGKVRRYADKVLRNADYFLDDLSLKPEMYRNTPIAAPNLLCHADTFLAFIPSGENAIWTDLRTGKVLSEGDSCLIFLNDEVLIEVKGENFRYVLKYSIKIPQSPFDKPVYQLCKGDSLKFQAESGFSAYWQFGKYQSNTYTHHYADTPVLQITYKSAQGCVYTYSAEVIKGPESNDFSIDTALCDQVKFHWNIPDSSWTLQAQNRVVKENNKLAISIPTDFNSEIVLIDTLSKCPITLKAQIASNTTPDLVNVQDTTLCYLDQYEVRVAPALWYKLNGTQVKQPIFIDFADRYELIAGNRNCTDTVSFTLLKYPEIEAKIEQLNPWTCYLDSPLIFSALPNKYQYYWQETIGPDSLFQQSDSLRINVMVLDSHGCERNYYISPKYACFKPVWIPNVFTPNGNGPEENERFAPSCVSCQTTYMRIYNRWGEMIYSGVEPWDGTYEGKLVPNGVYAYSLGVKISYGSQRSIQHFKGNVQVLR
jgi:gliding motility-associated-like protein